MNRRVFLETATCGVILAGCLGSNDVGHSSNYWVVARPVDTVPPEAPTTSVDDPKIDGPLEEVVVEAIETNESASQHLDDEERETTIERVKKLPQWEGDDEHFPARYVTRNDDAVVVEVERED